MQGEGFEPMKRHILAFCFFLIVGLLWNITLVRGLRTIVYGGAGDNMGSIWYFWWQKEAVVRGLSLDGREAFGLPFGFVRPASLYSPTSLTLGLLLTFLLGEIGTHNLLLVLSFPLSGFTAYLLCYYLSKSFGGSLLGGLIYTLCPYHTLQSLHYLSNATMQWLPLFVLLVFVIDEDRRGWVPLFCGGVYALNFLECLYYGYFGAIIWLIYIAYRVLIRRGTLRAKRHLVACGAALVLIGIFQREAIAVLLGLREIPAGVMERAGFVRSIDQLTTADLIHYFLPGPYNELFFGFLADTYLGRAELYFHPIEHGVYLGWCALVLSAIAVAKCREENRLMWFFVGVFCVGALLSMKPYLSVVGLKVPTLSFVAFKIAPMFRSIFRFYVLMILSLAVLSGFGYWWLVRGRGRLVQMALFILAGWVVYTEYLTRPPQRLLERESVPEPYLELAKLPGGIVADYPLELDDRMAVFYQRHHRHPLLNCTEATPTEEQYALVRTVRDLSAPRVPRILSAVGVRWVVVNLERFANPFNRLLIPPAEITGLEPVSAGMGVILYRVAASPARLSLLYGDGFASLDAEWKRVNARGVLFIFNTGPPSEAELSISAYAPSGRASLEIYQNSSLLQTLLLEGKPTNTRLTLRIKRGLTKLVLKSQRVFSVSIRL